ncbi:MAG: hypothetical protein FD152_3439 [Xanthobacteraceae bacterium]|nr:MAG: hypothetical protein FD152_3439 [Xanthobacteraceae bacterium]
MTTTTSAADHAIALNLAMVEEILCRAHTQAVEALGYTDDGNRTAAIGTVLGLDQALANAQAIYTAAVALHRRNA